MMIISGFSQFHQELFLLRYLSQTKSKLTILTFSHKSKNYLVNFLSLFRQSHNQTQVLTIDEVKNTTNTYLAYLSYFEKIERLNLVNDKVNLSHLFITDPQLKLLSQKKRIVQNLIVHQIAPTNQENNKIGYLTREVNKLSQIYKVPPEQILTAGQIRLLSLLNVKQVELTNIPGLGTGWAIKWSDTIWQVLQGYNDNQTIN